MVDGAVTKWSSFAERATILLGDCRAGLATLPERSVHCCVTSPPYFNLRDYQVDGQIGLEKTPSEYVKTLVEVFAEVWRVLRDDATFWLNLGDGYFGGGRGGNPADSPFRKQATNRGSLVEPSVIPPGMKAKDLIGTPWLVAFALRDAGWYLRSDIVWYAPNKMPETVYDRPTRAHEYVFLLTKKPRYYYDTDAIRQPHVRIWDAKTNGGSMATERHHKSHIGGSGRHTRKYPEPNPMGANKRTVWTVSTKPTKEAHFATFPPKLIEPCVLAGTSAHGCCPECGAPYKRIVERQRAATRPGLTGKTVEKQRKHAAIKERLGASSMLQVTVGNRDPERHVTTTKTVGWQATCGCDAGEPVPCTVLDPFLGSGTSALVAMQHGRKAIGCELNPEYVEIAKRRINKIANQRQLFV